MTPMLLFIPVAFACGSIPFGLLIARRRGIDIRHHGSRNIGATNVGRVLGVRAGLLCFALDLGKGLIPTLAAGWAGGVLGSTQITTAESAAWVLVVAAAILGHMYTPLAGFKGGKGVATGLGALLGVYPLLTLPALIALAVWIASAAVWRMVGLASVLAAVSLPLAVWGYSSLASTHAGAAPFYAGTTALALLVIWRHRTNLARIFQGTEPKLGRHRRPE